MKILHLITTLDRGGAEMQLVQQVRFQNIQGLETEIRYLKGKGLLAGQFEGERVGKIPGGFFLVQIIFLLFLVKRKKFDIVTAHLPRSELAAAIVSRLTNYALIVTKHNTEKFWPQGNEMVSKLLARFVDKAACMTICITKAVKDYLISKGELREENSVVIHYGIERKVKEKSDFPLPLAQKSSLRIICVARLEPQKNLMSLIELIPRISDLNPELRIFGVGSQREFLHSQINARALEDKIKLCGLTENPRGEMESSHLMILPSIYEGLGLVILEALDEGCLVIASRIPAVVEVLGNDYPLLFDPDSQPELELRVRQALYIESSWFSEYRGRVLKQFSLEVQFEKTSHLYNLCTKTDAARIEF